MRPPQWHVQSASGSGATEYIVGGRWQLKRKFPGKLLLVVVVLLQLGFFLFVARHHFIGGDEGFYLLASRLVLEGKVPYLDFFYIQAPLLPYIYGLWIKCFGISWISARTLSALLTTTLGVLLYVDVCQVTRKWIAGLAAVVLFMSSSLIYGSYPIAKTYSLAALCLYAAYVVVSRISASSSGWMIAVAGLFFGLSVSTRSYIVVVGPVFLWWILHQSEARSRYARLVWFLAGFTIGIAPSLCLFVASPSVYLFNNLGYHALRSGSGLIGDWQAKMFVAAAVFAGSDTGLQFSIVSAVCLVAIFLPRMRRATSLLPFLVALVLGFISILPTPPFVEYFCMCMPFLIVAAVYVANDSFGMLQSPAAKRIAGGTCVALFAMFVVMGALRFQRYVTTKHNPLEDVTAVSQCD